MEGRSRSDARVAFVAGALVAATIPAAIQALTAASRVPASALEATTSVAAARVAAARASERPAVNYRGPIRGLQEGEDRSATTVVPQRPLDLVTDDCSQLEFFEVDRESYDRRRRVLTLIWWDPGAKDRRSLTVYVDSPSCSRRDLIPPLWVEP